jgi:hypothetical protein
MPTKSILKIYDSYLRKLRKKRAELAMFQLTGKLEDRLTKEFASSIYSESAGALIALSNVGKRGEQKIDLAVLQGDFSKDIKRENAAIRAFIEAKYLRNAHKLCLGNAQDELAGSLKDLKRQLWCFDKPEHGGFPVKLSGQRKDIYGLVLASYVRPNDEVDKEKAFLKRIRDLAEECGLTFNDFPDYPWLPLVYEGEVVRVLKRKFTVSLRVGLWRAGQTAKAPAYRVAQA